MLNGSLTDGNGYMSKNAKKQLKLIQEKQAKEKKVYKQQRPKIGKCTVTILDLSECIDECLESKLITENDAEKIIDYAQSGNDGNYWKLYWLDIEEERIEPENVDGFRKFYEKYKEYEQKLRYSDSTYIMFDKTLNLKYVLFILRNKIWKRE